MDEVRLKTDALKTAEGQIVYEPIPIHSPGDDDRAVARHVAQVLQDVSPPYVALDRLLLTPDLPMEPAQAEKLVGLLHQNNRHLFSVVTYTVQSTSGSGSSLVLLGHVETVTLIGPEGEQLARYDASAFPPASTADDAAQAAADEKVLVEVKKRNAETRAVAYASDERARAEAARLASLETAKQDHERQIVEDQQRPPGAFGPEIGHIKLGMPLEEAEQVIRRSMNVVAVVEPKPGSWGYAPTLLHLKVFVSSDGGDMVSIADYPGGEPRVVSITRRLALPIPAVDQNELVKLLNDKYGQPGSTYGTSMMWAPNRNKPFQPCGQIMSSTQHSGFALSEGTLPLPRGRQSIPPADEYAKKDFAGPVQFDSNDASKAARELRECTTTIWAMYDLSPTDPYLETAVFDGGWLAKMIGDNLKASAPGRLEAVKTLLDQ